MKLHHFSKAMVNALNKNSLFSYRGWESVYVLYFSIYCAISLLMLHYAPAIYSHSYCSLLLFFFLLFSIPYLHLKCRKLGLFNFDTLFLFSFFCINYLHSVFIYPYDDFLPAFSFYYNNKVITHALALASVGISFYMLGNVVFTDKGSPKNKETKAKFNLSNISINFSERLSFILSACVFLYVILFVRGSFQHLNPRLMTLIVSCIILPCYYKAALKGHNNTNLISFYSKNRLNIISILLFCVALLIIGSRAHVIFLSLSLIMLINTYYFRVKFGNLFVCGCIGCILMAIIMLTRISDTNLASSSFIDVLLFGWERLNANGNFLWTLLLDFIVNARTLYESIDYISVNDYLYGTSYLQYLFCFIPGGGRFMTSFLLNKDTKDVATGYILTDFSNAPYGIGTNMIADLYMNFSVIGLIFILFLFGILVSRCEHCTSSVRSLIYCCLLGNSIYIPRASVFTWLDMFVFLLLLDLAIRSLPKARSILLGLTNSNGLVNR